MLSENNTTGCNVVVKLGWGRKNMKKFIRGRLARVFEVYAWRDLIYIVLFSYAATFFIRKGMNYEIKRYWGIAIVIFVLAIILGIANKNRRNYNRKLFLFSSIPFILSVIYYWFLDAFGSFDLGAILYHMRMGVEDGAVDDVTKLAMLYVCVAILFLVTIHYIARRDLRIVWMDRVAALPLLFVSPLLLGIADYYRHADDANKLIAYYAPLPADLKQPEAARKNLIVVYAESTERTFEELENGKTIFRSLNEIAAGGVTIKGIAQAANTGWTMAGIVSSQCGVPLQPNGLFAINKFETQSAFMPGAICLADLLQKNGYQTAYLNSASLKFAGTGLFMQGHGYQLIDGPDNYEGQWSDYRNMWGFHDDTMFELAFDQLSKLAEGEKPYLFAISTITGHFPNGFPTRSCLSDLGPIEEPSILYSVRCTGYEITRFLERARGAGYLDDDTLVVVTSDHLSMKSDVWDELNAHERTNFFTILGLDHPAETIEKKATMLDVYPTLLEALGFQLPDHQAGLGISLFSNRPTLAETLGLEKLDDLITYDKALGQRLWERPQPENVASVSERD